MLKMSELHEMGYKKACDKLHVQLVKDAETKRLKQARDFMSIGAIVNYSFYEMPYSTTYTEEDVERALRALGTSTYGQPGKKWYQFWLKNVDIRFINALKEINK